MKVYTSPATRLENESVVALGCFDGVHIGHSEIISKAAQIAKESSLTSVVWSFQAPPKSFFISDAQKKPSLITPLSEKRKLISALGIDTLISVEFNQNIAALSPREFFEGILVDKLRAKHILCGFNYRFGKGGEGNVKLLRSLCDEFGIALTAVDEITLDGMTVSSSAIRALLADGKVDTAQKMLGRPYSLRAKVKDGQHLGRKLGFPTVNQDFVTNKIIIKNGVYLTRVKFSGKIKYGVTNVGVRPTVQNKSLISETHIFDFNGSLYGKFVTVEFLKFLRSEKKFNSLNELSAQVRNDIKTAQDMLK